MILFGRSTKRLSTCVLALSFLLTLAAWGVPAETSDAANQGTVQVASVSSPTVLKSAIEPDYVLENILQASMAVTSGSKYYLNSKITLTKRYTDRYMISTRINCYASADPAPGDLPVYSGAWTATNHTVAATGSASAAAFAQQALYVPTSTGTHTCKLALYVANLEASPACLKSSSCVAVDVVSGSSATNLSWGDAELRAVEYGGNPVGGSCVNPGSYGYVNVFNYSTASPSYRAWVNAGISVTEDHWSSPSDNTPCSVFNSAANSSVRITTAVRQIIPGTSTYCTAAPTYSFTGTYTITQAQHHLKVFHYVPTGLPINTVGCPGSPYPNFKVYTKIEPLTGNGIWLQDDNYSRTIFRSF